MNLNNLKSKKYSAGEYIERGSACIMETDGTIYLFDITDSSHTLKYIGVAFNTCSQGQIIEIIQQGFLGWNGAPYQKGVVYYIGADSKLTSTPPISGTIKAVAIGLPSTVISGQPVQAVAITEEYDLTGSGGAVWGNITGVITDQTDLITYLGANYVPQARNITINGTTYDLSANRSWTVGDLLSSGSYTNPSWLVSIPWSKITSTPTTLSGYGITDAIDGSGTANQIPYFVDSNTLGSLSTSTYPSLTELSYVKGVTSAIQTQITNKEDKSSSTSGSVISFTTPQIYNSVASPGSSDITDDLTGARIGVIQKIYHNKLVAPTFPAGWVRLGSTTYNAGNNNIIFAEWISGTRVEYWIVRL